MSSNFYNEHAMHIAGVEAHDYVDAAGTTHKFHPHGSDQFNFKTWPAKNKLANNVTAERHSMIQQGHDFYLIAHCPLPIPPPGPATLEKLAQVILTSGSKCQMAVPSVTSGGGPLACCIVSFAGSNQNCSDPCDVFANMVMSLNSVETSPTAGDFAAAFASSVVDRAIGMLVGVGAGKAGERNPKNPFFEDALKQVWRRAPDYLPFLEKPTSWTSDFVKQMVDGATS
jgi:hypothetical protein